MSYYYKMSHGFVYVWAVWLLGRGTLFERVHDVLTLSSVLFPASFAQVLMIET